MRIGLLGFGAIGHEHAAAIHAVPDLELAAVCDPNEERLAVALEQSPSVATFTDAADMLASELLDAVIVSTPPNSHAQWAHKALSHDLHVIVEKPMALSASECDELLTAAQAAGKTVLVYQNRRFDADFLTLRTAIRSGRIGELYQLDTFVGGYSRPCDYWHSDAVISGGVIFDWGSHFIDQILNIVTDPIDYVTGINHKRHWHHVTNADHAVVRIVFTTGVVASFTHSDLAAARQPKYYALGTTGAIVGEWDLEAEPQVADRPALMTLVESSGTRMQLTPESAPEHQFHSDFASFVLNGRTMEVNPVQSRNVVAVMEAAEESARRNGRPVTPEVIA